jgi:hypothetical protein
MADFTTDLQNQTLVNERSLTYTLPPPSPSSSAVTITSSLPSFVTYTSGSKTFSMVNPQWGQVGWYRIDIRLTYSTSQSTWFFMIEVKANTYPYFNYPPQIVLVLPSTSTTTYSFPSMTDNEGDPPSIIVMSGLPGYCSISGSDLSCNPSSGASGSTITY